MFGILIDNIFAMSAGHVFQQTVDIHMGTNCIDDVLSLSLNNSSFGDFVDRIYPIELEKRDTTNTARSVSYLDLHLEINIEGL